MSSQPVKVKNFVFHRVNPVRDELWDPMDTARFEQCVRYLKKHYEVLALEEACDRDFSSASGRPIATITFDDGYHDNLEYAAPILQKYGCPASFYVVTDCMDTGHMVWTQELKHYLKNTKHHHFYADLSYLPPYLQVRKWRNRQSRLQYAHAVRDFLLTTSQEIRRRFLQDLRAALSDVAPLNIMMTWNDVRQLQSAGFIIGSHTLSHPVLPTLKSEEQIVRELLQSGRRIEEELGAFPLSIAYPFGAYNRSVEAAAHQCGYKFGLAANQQFFYSDKDTTYAISRTSLDNEPWLKTLGRIDGKFERLRGVLKMIRKPGKSFWIAANIVASATSLFSESLETLPY